MTLISALLLDPAPFSVWLACRADGIKGSGTASDPWNGSTAELFDDIMRNKVGPNTHVYLGPGSFTTKGYYDGAASDYGWQAKGGVKISGSGIDVTVLQLVAGAGTQTYAVAHSLVDYECDHFEISDLTIDCNLPPVATFDIRGAVRLMGNHARIQRVKAINWGTQYAAHCAVFSLVTSSPDGDVQEVAHSGIEDCIAIQPSINLGAVTVFHVGGVEGQSFSHEQHGKGPYIRNCFADCGVTTPNPTGTYRALSMGWCRGGVIEGNTVLNTDIAGPYQDTRSIRDLIVRHNSFRNVARGIVLNLGQLGSSLLTSNASLSVSGGVATISGGGLDTSSLAVGERVSIGTTTSNGVYQIISVQYTASPQFTVRASGAESSTVTSVKKVFGVSRANIEGNVIELTPGVEDVSAVLIDDSNGSGTVAEPPDYIHGEIIIRNNKICYLDDAVPDDEGAVLFRVHGAKSLTARYNLLDTISEAPIEAVRCGSEIYFDNRTVAGELVTMSEHAATDFELGLEIPAEDALTLACFHEF